MSERQKPVDDSLPEGAPGALYRTLQRDEPPPAIDAAVLAAARRSVNTGPARRWAAPAALAAVLVLSVGVTLRVADEKPDAQLRPTTPQSPAPVATGPAASPADAPAAAPEMMSKAPVAAREEQPAASQESAAPDQARRQQRVAPSAAPAGTEKATDAQAIARAPQEAAGLQQQSGAAERRAAAPALADPPPVTFVPSPQADSAQPSSPAMPVAPGAPAPDARTQSMSKSASAESSLASVAAQTPETWLERIALLRAQGRHKEAEESFAEFRRQHPDYIITPQMLQKIAPSR